MRTVFKGEEMNDRTLEVLMRLNRSPDQGVPLTELKAARVTEEMFAAAEAAGWVQRRMMRPKAGDFQWRILLTEAGLAVVRRLTMAMRELAQNGGPLS